MSYPNTVLSAWQLTIMAVVPTLALFGWLIAIFIAARPRQRDAATTLAGATGSRTGSAPAGPEGGAAADKGEPTEQPGRRVAA